MKKIINICLLLTVCAFLIFLPYYSANAVLDPYQYAETLGLPMASLEAVVISIVQWILGLLGLIAVIIILYSGFMWLTSGGNEEKIAKAKKIITAAIIGLAIIILSNVIFAYVYVRIINFGQ